MPRPRTRMFPAAGEAGGKTRIGRNAAGATLVDNPLPDLVHYLLSR